MKNVSKSIVHKVDHAQFIVCRLCVSLEKRRLKQLKGLLAMEQMDEFSVMVFVTQVQMDAQLTLSL